MCEVEKVPNYCARSFRRTEKKERCVHVQEKKKERKFFRLKGRGKAKGSHFIKSWHHQDARDEHVRINGSFFLGRTRDDQHHPKAKGERERERERAQPEHKSSCKARERCGASRG